MTTGSTLDSGIEPCAPRPKSRTSRLSAAACVVPGAVADRAGRGGHDVLAEDDVGLGEAVEQAVVDHRLGALGRLLGGLEDREHGARATRRGTRASRVVAPASHVTCMSCPQACITGTSWPSGSVAVAVLA